MTKPDQLVGTSDYVAKGYPKVQVHAPTNAVESLRKVIRYQKYAIHVRDYLYATLPPTASIHSRLYNPCRGGDVLVAWANKQAWSYSMSTVHTLPLWHACTT